MKRNNIPHTLNPIPKHLCLLLFAMLFAFSCSNTEIPELPQSSDGLQNGSEQQIYCYYFSAEQCIPVDNSTTECPGEGFVVYTCPNGEGGNDVSATRCKDDQGRNYFCQWTNGSCWAIDPAFSETEGANCDSEIQACRQHGSIYFNSTVEGENTRCSGGEGNSSSGGTQSGGNSSSSQGAQSGSNSSSSSVSSGGLVSPSSGPVYVYGALKACSISSKGQICGSKGSYASKAVQVRGVSLGWSNSGWESASFFNSAAINAMVDGWQAEIIRVPMGYSYSTTAGEYYGSYLSQKSSNMSRVRAAVEAAIIKGVYVVIDWHSHDAHSGTSDALEFFEEMARDYGSYDNVIFEIYNEPLNISWATIKSYATSVISKIRSYSPNNLIVVGTPNWDQDVDAPAGNWISDNNVAYVFHFYANTHALSTFQGNINAVLSAGRSVFVTEYGTVSADGDGSHNGNSSDEWLAYLNSNNISYCAWNVNNKGEASSFFVSSFTPSASANWTSTSNITTSGRYIYNNLIAWRSNAPWNGGEGNTVSSTRCKDTSNRDYFCEWDTGCYAIDPTYSESSGNCTTLVSECRQYGTLYVNSAVEGANTSCNGTKVN